MEKIHFLHLSVKYFFSNFIDYFLRLVHHFFGWIPGFNYSNRIRTTPILWLGDLLFYLVDLLGISLLIQVFYIIIFPVRKLSEEEEFLAQQFFDTTIDYRYVLINSKMPKRFKNFAHAFVSLNIINYPERISNAIFIHELVHIWQYQQFGTVYIFRAILAQFSNEGYDYGGVEGLYNDMIQGKDFLDFNFEQQGEIFEDYCRILDHDEYQSGAIAHAVFVSYIRQVNSSFGQTLYN